MREILNRSIPPDIKRADLHIHTEESRDGHMTLIEAVEWNGHLGLDAIAITDHDMIKSAEKVWNIKEQKGYSFDVIIGSEISSHDGHIIGLFLEKDIPKGLSAEETVYKIHEQNGLAIAPHAGYRALSSSLSLTNPGEVSSLPLIKAGFDGFEVYNGGVAFQAEMKRRRNRTPNTANERALEFYQQHNDLLGAPIGASDNHFHVYGRITTGFKKDIRDEIESRETLVLLSEGSELKEIFTKANKYFGDEKVPLERILEFENKSLS